MIILIYLFIAGCVLFIFVTKILKYINKGVCVFDKYGNVKTFINYIFFNMDSKNHLYNSLIRPFLVCFKSVVVVVSINQSFILTRYVKELKNYYSILKTTQQIYTY